MVLKRRHWALTHSKPCTLLVVVDSSLQLHERTLPVITKVASEQHEPLMPDGLQNAVVEAQQLKRVGFSRWRHSLLFTFIIQKNGSRSLRLN